MRLSYIRKGGLFDFTWNQVANTHMSSYIPISIRTVKTHLDDRIRVSDGTPVRGVEVRDPLRPGLHLPDAAQLVLGLGRRDAVDGESSLHVVDDAEVLPSLLNLDDVHEASGELGISPRLAVNLNQPLLHNGLHLLGGQGILQTVPGVQCRSKDCTQPKGFATDSMGENGFSESIASLKKVRAIFNLEMLP